ncbi:MAG: LysM peptidoglycan-binding domain-containing protein [Anaerolineae bacterium]|nr:LysM peptidoglycan-binding domain-containing protein [Anaerolineae bacterium]
MRFWFALLGGVALLFISACTLNTRDVVPTAASTQVSLITPLPSLSPTFTLTPQPTSTSIPPTNTRVPAGATLVNCFPRADWLLTYTVATGDNLSKIATLVGSNVAALQQGNCLVDANQIVVGQKLRVPSMPPTVTATQPGTVNRVGGVELSEILSGDAGSVYLLRDSTLTLTWVDAPAGLTSVSFLLVGYGYPTGTDNTIHATIGQLTDLTSPVSITWKVPAGLKGEDLIARGQLANSTVYYSFAITVNSAPPSGQGCEISPSAGRVNVYLQPDANSDVFGVIDPGQYIEVLGRTLNGWYGLDPGVGQPTPNIARLRWLSPDEAYVQRGNC